MFKHGKPSWQISSSNLKILSIKEEPLSTLLTLNKWCAYDCTMAREKKNGEEGKEMEGRVQLITWWWNFSVSFIIKQLSVIDLRRSVSEWCGIRGPNCSEAMHYSTGILKRRLVRTCQFFSGGLGVAATLYTLNTPNVHYTCSCESINIYTIQEQKGVCTQTQTFPLWLQAVDFCFAL